MVVGGSLPNPMRAWVSSMAPRRVASASRPASGNPTVPRFFRGFLFHLQTKKKIHNQGTTHQFDQQTIIRSIHASSTEPETKRTSPRA